MMCSSVIFRALLLNLLVGCVSSFLVHDAGLTLDVKLDLTHQVSSTDDRFLGVTLDSSLILYGHISRMDISSPLLKTLTQALSPAYLRVGGTKGDALTFNPSITGNRNTEFGADIWDKLNNFAHLAKWDMIWDFDYASLYKNYHWDPSNAKTMLQYSQDHGYKLPCFQLGNEPNLFYYFYHVWVTPQSLARDYQNFKTDVHSFPQYRDACILGPELTNISDPNHKKYITEFLQAGGGKALDGLTIHHYYECSNTFPISLGWFMDLRNFEAFENQLNTATQVVKQYAPRLPLWLSETSTVIITCPGEPNLRTTYANGFLYLDKLGMSARYGLKHVIRHQFFSQLVNSTYDFTPFTDYFVTLLYKRLVQGPVFKVLTSTPTVRMYAHCANPDSYQKGAIVVYAINIESADATLSFSQFHGQQFHLYLLTPGDQDGLTSKYIALNDQKLEMNGNQLPAMNPKVVHGANTVTLRGRSYGFVVLPDANVDVCKH